MVLKNKVHENKRAKIDPDKIIREISEIAEIEGLCNADVLGEAQDSSNDAVPSWRELPEDAECMEVQELASEQLLQLFRVSGDTRWRDEVVHRHLPDVAQLARILLQKLPKSVHFEDLCNAGQWGLLRCLDTYDPKKARFASYLKIRVYGAMIDELRALDWLPKLLRSRFEQRDRLLHRLRGDLGRQPTDEEMAEGLNVSLAVYRRSYPTQAPSIGSGILSGDDREFEGFDGKAVGFGLRGKDLFEEVHPLTPMYRRELIDRIHGLCSDTEWSLVELHYFQGLKLNEVAERLDLSPARICQIHGKILTRLKEKLQEESPQI